MQISKHHIKAELTCHKTMGNIRKISKQRGFKTRLMNPPPKAAKPDTSPKKFSQGNGTWRNIQDLVTHDLKKEKNNDL